MKALCEEKTEIYPIIYIFSFTADLKSHSHSHLYSDTVWCIKTYHPSDDYRYLLYFDLRLIIMC